MKSFLISALLSRQQKCSFSMVLIFIGKFSSNLTQGFKFGCCFLFLAVVLAVGSFGAVFIQSDMKNIIIRHLLSNYLLEKALLWQRLRSEVIKHYLKWTIPLKEAASLLWGFYRDPLQSLTLLSLNAKNCRMAFSSSKEPSFLISDPTVFNDNVINVWNQFGRARNHGKKFLNLGQTSFSGIVNCVLFVIQKVSKLQLPAKGKVAKWECEGASGIFSFLVRLSFYSIFNFR